MSRPPPALIALTPGNLSEREFDGAVRLFKACAGSGLLGVVVREPGLSDRATLELAQRLRAVLSDGWLCVHDRVHLAAFVGADAVHLGWRSLAPERARDVVGDTLQIGLSTHVGDDTSLHTACDYLFFGPVRDTPSKHGFKEPTGFAGLARAVAGTARPIWALGGMNPEDVAAVRASGAAGVAVLGGLVRAADPAAQCVRYLEGFEGPRG